MRPIVRFSQPPAGEHACAVPSLFELCAEAALIKGCDRETFDNFLEGMKLGAIPRQIQHPALQQGEGWAHYLAIFGTQSEEGTQPVSLAQRFRGLREHNLWPAANPEAPSLILTALEAANAETVLALIEAGADLNQQDIKGQTALHHALQLEVPDDLISDMLEHGADIWINDQAGHSALTLAAIKNRPEVITDMLSRHPLRTDTAGESPLNAAAEHGHVEALGALLAAGWPIAPRHGGESSALHTATEHGKAASVPILIEHGAAIDSLDHRGCTPLLALCRTLRTLSHMGVSPQAAADTIAALVESGANINAVPKQSGPRLYRQDNMRLGGRTPLHWAVCHNHPAAVAALIRLGADLGAEDATGRTPADLAAPGSKIAQLLRARANEGAQTLCGSI